MENRSFKDWQSIVCSSKIPFQKAWEWTAATFLL